MEQSKTCTKCGQIKSLSEFALNKQHRDGRQSACKKCYTSKYNQWDKSGYKCQHCQDSFIPKLREQNIAVSSASAKLNGLKTECIIMLCASAVEPAFMVKIPKPSIALKLVKVWITISNIEALALNSCTQREED